jgi:hypothetical protein
MRSAQMSRAPASACEDVGHLFAASMKAFASSSGLPSRGCARGDRERLEAALAGDDGAGALLRLVGQVEVFELGLGLDFEDLLFRARR